MDRGCQDVQLHWERIDFVCTLSAARSWHKRRDACQDPASFQSSSSLLQAWLLAQAGHVWIPLPELTDHWSPILDWQVQCLSWAEYWGSRVGIGPRRSCGDGS